MERRSIDLSSQAGRQMQVIVEDSKIIHGFISAEFIRDGISGGIGEASSIDGALEVVVPRVLLFRARETLRQEDSE